jgi:hypothetical protein
MAKNRTNRRSKSKSRSRRGGAQVFGGGSSWAPAANNTYAALTKPSAIGNHFKLSPHGVPSGGVQPPVPAMSGPGAGQFNKIWPPVGFKGGGFGRKRSTSGRSNRKRSTSGRSNRKRSTSGRSNRKRSTSGRSNRSRSRSKKGGGLFQFAQTAWDNATIGVRNLVNGYNGTSQLHSASPWIQPALTKPPNIPLAKPINLPKLTS